MRGLPGPGASLRGPFPFQTPASLSLGKGLIGEAASDGGSAAGEGTLGPKARHVGARAPAQPACLAILAAQVWSRAPFCPGIEFHFQPLLGGSHGSLQTFDKEAKYTLESEKAWAFLQSARAGLRRASPPRPRVRLGPQPIPGSRCSHPNPPPRPRTQLGSQAQDTRLWQAVGAPWQPKAPRRKKGGPQGGAPGRVSAGGR